MQHIQRIDHFYARNAPILQGLVPPGKKDGKSQMSKAELKEKGESNFIRSNSLMYTCC